MALTPEEIQEMDKITGFKSVDPHQDAISSRLQELQKLRDKQTTGDKVKNFVKDIVKAPATIIARPIQAVAELAGASAEQVDATTKKLTGGLVAPVPQNASDVKKDVGRGLETAALGLGPVAGGAAFGTGNSLEQGNDLFSLQTALETALGAGGGKLLDVVGKPLFNAAGKAIGKVTPDYIKGLVDKGGAALTDFAESHNVLPKGASNAVNDTASTLRNVTEHPIDSVKKVADQLAPDYSVIPEVQQKLDEGAVQKSVDALTPELKGKKLTGAYKEVMTGNRTIRPATVFSEQKLSPGDQVEKLGSRLKDVVKSGDPYKNLNSLSSEMTTTEQKIQDLFANDPEIQFNADKQGLNERLDKIKTVIPREFSSIRDSKAVFDDVVHFGKELVDTAVDTPKGLRDARINFDRQAQLEYPNAFKDGGIIDLKTPAGRAIKAVRDSFNEHLYETAPNGSEIQKLIAHEADLYRANELVAEKAAKIDGLNKFMKWVKLNPGKAKALGIVATGLGLSTIGGAAYANKD